jgi:hypothetical protein
MLYFKRNLIITAVFVCSFLFPSALHAQTKAELQSTDTKDKEALVYATNYRIVVFELKEKLTVQQIADKQTFTVLNIDTGKTIEVTGKYGGGVPKDGRYHSAYLWGDFRTDVNYAVIIRYPTGETTAPIKVEKAVAMEEKESSAFQLISDRLSFSLDLQEVENTNAFAFTYSLDYVLGQITGKNYKHQYRFSFSADGEVSTDTDDSEIQSSMKEGINFDYRYHAPFTMTVPQPKGLEPIRRTYSYPLGFRLKPVEFEHAQDFELANYTVKVQAVVTVPFSELPVFWLHAATGVNRPFYPLLIYTGYTYSSEISDDTGVQEDDAYSRWDLELVYNFPIAKNIDFRSRWRAFFNLDTGDKNDLLELAAKIYTDSKRTTGFIVKYEEGALPPEFKESSSLRVGLSYDFF